MSLGWKIVFWAYLEAAIMGTWSIIGWHRTGTWGLPGWTVGHFLGFSSVGVRPPILAGIVDWIAALSFGELCFIVGTIAFAVMCVTPSPRPVGR